MGHINTVTLEVTVMQFIPSTRNGCSQHLILCLLPSDNATHFKTFMPTPPPLLAEDLCLVHGIMVTAQGGEEREKQREQKHTSILIRPVLCLLSFPSNFATSCSNRLVLSQWVHVQVGLGSFFLLSKNICIKKLGSCCLHVRGVCKQNTSCSWNENSLID